MDEKNADKPLWLRPAYGSEADDTLAFLGPTTEQIETAVDKFYRTILDIPNAHEILRNTSHREFQNLRAAQADYLVKILAPGVSREQHREMAAEAGYCHCFVGVPSELLTESSILYTDIASILTLGSPKEEELKNIITRRLQFDLVTQIEAYADVQHKRLMVYDQIAQQGNRDTPLDFMQDVLSRLLHSFDKDVAGVAFGTVKNGTYRHLLAQGRIPFGAKTENDFEYPTINIKNIEEAWFNEKSYIKNNLHDESDIPPGLKEECATKGIRSFGFFILHDLQYAPKAYLLICGKFPGYFMDKSMKYYWHHLADLIGNNFDILERSRVKRHKRLADGFNYRQLLARQKLEMYYQPIIDPSTGHAVKVEALARLKDGEQIISPGMFLPAFGTNQLRDLFEIGLEQVLRNLAQVSGSPLLCSINLPPEAMLDREWLRSLPNFLEKAGASPQRICLEILESSFHDDAEVMKLLFQLQEAGYSIFLDDVGAGESSLLRLVNLPVSGIKIDQSFVRSLRYNFNNLDLILSLRFLAFQRNLECVAEGVESMDIVDTLVNMSSGQILLQGYAFKKPMALHDLAEWLHQEANHQPVPPKPQSLCGWYSRHVGRLFTMRNALFTISDLINIERLQNAELCPLHEIIPEVGGDPDLIKAHQDWHINYSRFAEMIQSGSTAQDLWQAMETSERELQALVEGRVHPGMRNKRDE